MTDFLEAPLIPIIFVAVAGLAIYAWHADKKRRELISSWVLGRGWRLRPGKVKGMHTEYPMLKFFNKGHSRSAKYVITGDYEGRPLKLMDYKYVTGSGKNRTTHNVGVLILETAFPVIPMTIRRENALDKIGEFLGADDIDFESAEFSRKFYVKSGDRKWAYDVIHQRTMDFLLSSPAFNISFGFMEIAITKNGHFSPDGYEEAMKLAWGMYDLIPDYVVQQMKGEGR